MKQSIITTDIVLKIFHEHEDLIHVFEYIEDDFEESYFHTIKFNHYTIYISEYFDDTEIIGSIFKGGHREPNFQDLNHIVLLNKIKKYIKKNKI